MTRSKDPIFDLFPELISLAGRQRMLSHRIGFFLLKLRMASLGGGAVLEDDIAGLQGALDLFEGAEDVLERGVFEHAGRQMTFSSLTNILSGHDRSLLQGLILSGRRIVEDAASGEAVDEEMLASLIDEIPGEVLRVLQDVVDRLQEEFAERSTAEALVVKESMEKVTGAVDRIEKAARYSKMVSLNARVAAGRAGVYGAEFSALSSELKEVANSIEEAAEDVSVYLKAIA